jgi:hypothetical protein
MNKIKILFIVSLAFLVQTQSVSAGNIILDKINQIKENIELIKNKSAEEQSLIKSNLSSSTVSLSIIEQKVREKLSEQKIRFLNPFDQTFKNLKNLSERIKSRIDKMKESGMDMSVSEELILISDEQINIVEKEIIILTELLSVEITPVSPDENEREKRKIELEIIKNQTEKIKRDIKTSHASLIKVINSLKGDFEK